MVFSYIFEGVTFYWSHTDIINQHIFYMIAFVGVIEKIGLNRNYGDVSIGEILPLGSELAESYTN